MRNRREKSTEIPQLWSILSLEYASLSVSITLGEPSCAGREGVLARGCTTRAEGRFCRGAFSAAALPGKKNATIYRGP